MPDERPEAVVVEREGDAKPKVKTLAWYTAIAVRVGRTYLQNLAGILIPILIIPGEMPSLAGTTYVLGPFIAKGLIAAQYALFPAIIALLQNAIELLTKLDQSHPEWRA